MGPVADREVDPARIDAAIAAMSTFLGRPWFCERARTGITNENWIVRSEAGTFFVKLHDRAEPRAQISCAIQAAKWTTEAGIGAPLVEADAENGIEIYAFLEGYRSATAEDLSKTPVQAKTASLYRKLQQLPALPLTRTGFDLLVERLASAERLGADLPEDLPAMLALCERARAGIAGSGMVLVPAHNDSHLENLLIGPDGDLRLIDWDYASNNDACWDVAMFASASSMAPEATIDFAAAILGDCAPGVQARLRVYRFVICVSWAIWAAGRARTSTIPFDYAGHSAMILNAARAMTAGPALEADLCRL